MQTLFLPCYTCVVKIDHIIYSPTQDHGVWKLYVLLCKIHHLKNGTSFAIFQIPVSIMRTFVAGLVFGTDA